MADQVRLLVLRHNPAPICAQAPVDLGALLWGVALYWEPLDELETCQAQCTEWLIALTVLLNVYMLL